MNIETIYIFYFKNIFNWAFYGLQHIFSIFKINVGHIKKYIFAIWGLLIVNQFNDENILNKFHFIYFCNIYEYVIAALMPCQNYCNY